MRERGEQVTEDRDKRGGEAVFPAPGSPHPASPIPHPVNIIGDRVALGPVRSDLMSTYTRWMNDLMVLRTKDDPPLPMTTEAYAAVVEQVTNSDSHAWFTMYEADEADEADEQDGAGGGGSLRPVGVCGLFDIQFRHRTAEYGIHIGEADARGRGLGTEATRLILDYAFFTLGLHNVLLRVFASNIAGRRAYEKAGYREMGVREESWMMGGQLRDVVYMQCLSTWFERVTARAG